MPWITKEGRTVDEARDAAVAAAGATEEELEIEVVSEGAKGLFGLGGEPAIVRVRPRSEAADFRAAFHFGLPKDFEMRTAHSRPAKREKLRRQDADRCHARDGRQPAVNLLVNCDDR